MALPSSSRAPHAALGVSVLAPLLAAALGCASIPDAEIRPKATSQGAPSVAPWVERFGDGEAVQVSAPAVDAAGDVVVTGSFLGTIDFGDRVLTAAPGGSMFVAKLDPEGHALWSEGSLPSQGHLGAGHAVVMDGQGNVLLVGRAGAASSRGDDPPEAGFFVAKLDPSGNPVWQKPLLPAYERFNLAVNGGGFAMLSARIAGGLYVEMVEPTGEECWSLSFPTACVSSMTGIASNASGTLALTGFYDCPVDFGGGPLPSDGAESVFVASFDANGNFLWSRGVGADGGSVAGRSVAMNDAGNVLVAGDYTGSPDFGDGALPASSGGMFVTELGPKGASVWSRGYDHASPLGSGALALAPSHVGAASSRVFLLGAAAGPVDFGPGAPGGTGGGAGAFVLELTGSGAFAAVHDFASKGASSGLQGGGIAGGASGGPAFAGLLSGTVDFGAATLTSEGALDVVVGHLAP